MINFRTGFFLIEKYILKIKLKTQPINAKFLVIIIVRVIDSITFFSPFYLKIVDIKISINISAMIFSVTNI